MKTRIIGLLFLVSLLLFTLLNFSNCNPANGDSVKIENEREPTIEYGIVTDSFKVVIGLIKPGQVLGEILYLNHIDHREIDLIVKILITMLIKKDLIIKIQPKMQLDLIVKTQIIMLKLIIDKT